MPNCEFYAVGEDLKQVLSIIFNDSGCRVFESYSPYEKEIMEFKSIEDIQKRYPLGICKKRAPSVLLSLWPIKASKIVGFKKIMLDPKKCEGATFRYTIEEWGLIGLNLGGVSELGIVPSHTNHNSEKRALKWSLTYPDSADRPESWDWKEVTKVSNQLNRNVRKLADAKSGSRVILPEASLLLAQGSNLLPY